ncbi:hypothetical protein PoB_004228500 [Plakobranchus ocellatus]|uniref:RING-type domain-containing protein n=1 Tax=Plakobranchus ocellatus TaxID=259542 RepID=A0AAV4B9K7_9GAST|nr:hypothetical protein PoB_004228500 [Plakobranchus ocellatus]
MEPSRPPEVETITSADVESTADSPATLTANLFFCSACQCVYRQPKILPCLHSFCRPCLVGMVSHGPEGSTIRCPSCQYKAPLPASGVVGVPDNAFLNRLCQNYISELQTNLQDPELQGKSSRPTFTTAALVKTRSRDSRSTRERRSREGSREPGTLPDTCSDDEEEEEEGGGPLDPFASERAAPGEGSDQSTLDAIHNRNRLQAKMMGLQGEALRLTYAIDHINSWPEEWQQKREDLKRAVRAQSSQLQFAVKRAERALLARIDDGGRSADHRFLMAAEVSKQKLRDSLRNVLQEVNVLKGVKELGTDMEVNSMCAVLLGRSVGMEEVALDMPSVTLEGLAKKDNEMHEMMAKNFGNLIFSEERTKVFKPEPVDFSQLPVEDFVSKALTDETATFIGSISQSVAMSIKSEAEESSDITSPTAEDSQEGSSGAGSERRSRKRSTADKRRHMTDLGLDSPDVREYLAQFQSARETFRARRKEILQQGQLGRVSAASPARAAEAGLGGLEAVRARLRSTSREGGRIQSLDRSLQPVQMGAQFSEVPRLMTRRGSAPIQRSSSLSRLHSSGLGVTLLPSKTSKHLTSASAGKPPPSPVREESLTTKDSVPEPLASTLIMQQGPFFETPRRHSFDAIPSLEELSTSTAAELLTQGDAGAGGAGCVSSRPIRRAISSGADKRAKIEILRETWHRRKEVLIQNDGFMTPESRSDSASPRVGSPKQVSSPPISPKAGQGEEPHGDTDKSAPSEAKPSTYHHENSPVVVGRPTDPDPQPQREEVTHATIAPASSFTSMYSSHGAPSAHLLDTVKIPIPEVSERTSPTPETMKAIERTIVWEQPKTEVITTTIEPGKVITMETTDSITASEALSVSKDVQPSASKQTDGSESHVEEVISTDSTVMPHTSSDSAAESTTANPEPEAKTTAAPRYFFKSRLTGLPVGGTATTCAQLTPTKPTYFFTSRITGLPVGGPKPSSSTSTTTSPTAAAAATPKTTYLESSTTSQSAVSLSTSPASGTEGKAGANNIISSSAVQTAADTRKNLPAPVSAAKSTTVSSPQIREQSADSVSITTTQRIPRAEGDVTPTTEAVSTATHGMTPAIYTAETAAHDTSPLLFKSRLTSMPAGGTSSVSDTSTTSRTTATSYFKSKLSDEPVKGAGLATLTTSSSAPTTFSKARLSEQSVEGTSSTATSTSTVTTTSFFKSRLTREPEAGTATATSSTTATPFFRSRLTGQTIGGTTTSTSTTSPDAKTSSGASSTTSSGYSSRYNLESRYKPRESVDVASLISAMYKGNEKQIISPTKASTTDKPATASAASDLVQTTVTAASSNTGTIQRELPPLRSAPTTSYTRRYNMSPSTQAPITTTSQRSIGPSGVSEIQRESSTSSVHQDLRSSSSPGGTTYLAAAPFAKDTSSLRHKDTIEVVTTEVYHRVPKLLHSGSPGTAQIVAQYHTSSDITVAGPTDTFKLASSSTQREHLAEDGQASVAALVPGSAVPPQSQRRMDQKLDYPRAHLPDVIPETTLKVQHTSEEDISVQAFESKPEIMKSASSSAAAVKTNEQFKKAYGFETDSEISLGISITEAIRKSGSPQPPRASSKQAGIPEPLDLQGATAASPTGGASSPGRGQSRSPVPPPSSSQSGDKGIKGRLKEIARKKKERWRHFTIH